MIFEKYLKPDLMLNTYDELTPEILTQNGINYLICDIDNTLVTYDDEEPTKDVLIWMDKLQSAGITIAFVSNNNKERVDRFNRKLQYTAYAKSHKPLTGSVKAAMKDMGADKKSAALLGDQLLTDAAAANFAGIYSIIVPPIKDKKNIFFKLKRKIEKPYIRKFREERQISSCSLMK